VKPTGILISPRCGISAALVQSTINQAFLFGGVYDEDEDNEENLHGTFYNDLFALDLENLCWRSVTLSEKKETVTGTNECRRRKKKQKEETNKELEQSTDSDEETVEDRFEKLTYSIDEDGIFTVSFYFINYIYVRVPYFLLHIHYLSPIYKVCMCMHTHMPTEYSNNIII